MQSWAPVGLVKVFIHKVRHLQVLGFFRNGVAQVPEISREAQVNLLYWASHPAVASHTSLPQLALHKAIQRVLSDAHNIFPQCSLITVMLPLHEHVHTVESVLYSYTILLKESTLLFCFIKVTTDAWSINEAGEIGQIHALHTGDLGSIPSTTRSPQVLLLNESWALSWE